VVYDYHKNTTDLSFVFFKKKFLVILGFYTLCCQCIKIMQHAYCLHPVAIRLKQRVFKVLVYPKMKIMSFITHPHVVLHL